MFFKIKKDKNYRKNTYLKELEYCFSKSLILHTRFEKHLMLLMVIFFKSNFWHKFMWKYKNRCILTGRNRAIFRYFRISRLQLKVFAKSGYLSGIAQSSW